MLREHVRKQARQRKVAAQNVQDNHARSPPRQSRAVILAVNCVVRFLGRLYRRGKGHVPDFQALCNRLHPPRLPLECSFAELKTLGDVGFLGRGLEPYRAMVNWPLIGEPLVASERESEENDATIVLSTQYGVLSTCFAASHPSRFHPAP